MPTQIAGETLNSLFSNNDAKIHSYDAIQPLQSISNHFVSEVSVHIHCSFKFEEDKPETSSPLDNLNFHSNDERWEAKSTDLKKTTGRGRLSTK